jgi:hypothetical protein
MTASAASFARPENPDRLSFRLRTALDQGGSALAALADTAPSDRRDRFETLLGVYALSTAPLAELGDHARHAGSPAIAAVKSRLEGEWLAEMDARALPGGLPADPVDAMRALAARDRLPSAYRWLATEAGWDDLVRFLAIEGGPDGGFDDLVAICQVGLSGSAKLELARNYWDEMGRGRRAGVHTTMYEAMASAIGMPHLAPDDQPVEALERVALGGLFATNHWLQPEMLGALGLIELQAGPRCRLVLRAFDRLGAPSAAYPFYAEHAEVDPVHGKDWLERAVAPICAAQPDWAPRILRGAWWRSCTNGALFDVLVEAIGQRASERAA